MVGFETVPFQMPLLTETIAFAGTAYAHQYPAFVCPRLLHRNHSQSKVEVLRAFCLNCRTGSEGAPDAAHLPWHCRAFGCGNDADFSDNSAVGFDYLPVNP
jgi:hypothetical protein